MSARMNPLIMVDGINYDVAAIKARYPGNPVAGYGDGLYEWTQQEINQFPAGHIWISITGKIYGPRVIDVENGAATPAEVPGFIAERAKLGYGETTTVYCSAANVGAIARAVNLNNVPRWWIAWYWGYPGPPSVDQVQREVLRLSGISLPVSKIWACQYASFSQWDLSEVYGVRDFSK